MATPMIDDIELAAVQRIRQETDQGFARHAVAGLDGTVHQKLGRRSHRVTLSGVLLRDTAAADLEKLQKKAASGEEVTFTADITTALEIQKMVIESFRAQQEVGAAGQTAYAITLAESPELPPPAEVSAFGGLGDFGLGDIGFDADALGGVLDDIAAQAGAALDAADAVMAAVDQLQALAALGNLGDLGNPVRPVAEKAGDVAALGGALTSIGNLVRGL